ncbi:MAG: sulfite exporter TauE/SafE family protein [Candidatus Caldarchaeum sp.]
MVSLEEVVVFVFAGFLGAITGLGGASITTPLLTLLGVPIKNAIAAGMVAIIATSSGSSASYVKKGLSNIRAAMFLEMFTITGAIIGATVTTFIAPRLLYLFFAGFLLTSFIGMRRFAEELPRKVSQDRISK